MSKYMLQELLFLYLKIIVNYSGTPVYYISYIGVSTVTVF